MFAALQTNAIFNKFLSGIIPDTRLKRRPSFVERSPLPCLLFNTFHSDYVLHRHTAPTEWTIDRNPHRLNIYFFYDNHVKNDFPFRNFTCTLHSLFCATSISMPAVDGKFKVSSISACISLTVCSGSPHNFSVPFRSINHSSFLLSSNCLLFVF